MRITTMRINFHDCGGSIVSLADEQLNKGSGRGKAAAYSLWAPESEEAISSALWRHDYCSQHPHMQEEVHGPTEQKFLSVHAAYSPECSACLERESSSEPTRPSRRVHLVVNWKICLVLNSRNNRNIWSVCLVLNCSFQLVLKWIRPVRSCEFLWRQEVHRTDDRSGQVKSADVRTV
jgi:hypothetical protein